MHAAKINVKNDSEGNVQYISGKFKNWNIVKDNIRDKLLHVMETIIARFDAEFPIFLHDVDTALKMSF